MPNAPISNASYAAAPSRARLSIRSYAVSIFLNFVASSKFISAAATLIKMSAKQPLLSWLSYDRFARLMRGLAALIDRPEAKNETNFHCELCLMQIHWRLAYDFEDKNLKKNKAVILPNGERIKIAIMGQFSGLLSFGPDFFDKVPSYIDLTVVDFPWRGVFADYLKSTRHSYFQIQDDRAPRPEEIAKIQNLEPTIICNLYSKIDPRFIARLDSYCWVNFCSGSVPYYSSLIDFQLCPQFQRNYILKNGELIHRKSQTLLKNLTVFESSWPFDPRDIDDQQVTPISARPKRIFFHGSLYKLSNPRYLDVIFSLIAEIPDVEMAFMGREIWGHEMKSIVSAARKWNVESRISYLGDYENIRGASGAIADGRWQVCRSELNRCRLWLGTFPPVGASARVEAMKAGAVVVQMGFPADWMDSPSDPLNIWELPCIKVDEATSNDLAQYKAICRQVLLDDRFAEDLIECQNRRLPQILDQTAIWRDLMESFKSWQSANAATHRH
jgi:hypothetical protein